MGLLCISWIFTNLLVFSSVFVILVSSENSWDKPSVTAKQGDEVTLVCTVTDLGPFDPVRIIKRNGETKVVITEDEDIKKPFASTSRYSVGFKMAGNEGILTLTFKGIRGEDAGELGCCKTGGENQAAYITLKVNAPVESVSLFSVQETTEFPVSSGGNIKLGEGEDMGVLCVAKADGSMVPPTLRLYIDSEDITSRFEFSNSSIEDNPGQSLALFSSEARAKYQSSMPDIDFNQRNLTCVATMESFPPVSASANLDIDFSPVLTCDKYELFAKVGDSLSITCKVKSSPSSRVVWSYGDEEARAEPITSDSNKGIVLQTNPLNGDSVEVSLVIDVLGEKHFTYYYLSADNDIDIANVRLHLKEGAPEKDPEYTHEKPAAPQEVLGDPSNVASHTSTNIACLVGLLASVWLLATKFLLNI